MGLLEFVVISGRSDKHNSEKIWVIRKIVIDNV